jgi:hypothetical protein
LNLKLSLKTRAGNSMMSEQLQIAIVGGGIGGLTTALALRVRGLNVTVFEQAGEQREIGAGICILPNAALLPQRIGLTDRIIHTTAWMDVEATKLGLVVEIPQLGGLWEIVEIFPYRLTNKQLKRHHTLILS